jgi:hypothetical protein
MTVQGDSESRLPPPPHVDLWRLPRILAVDIRRLRYLRPRPQIRAGKLIDVREEIEILVSTDGEIPMRALAAALYVGEAEVVEGERIDATTYRFFAEDEKALRPGAPIRLGWAGLKLPPGETASHYDPPEGSVERDASKPPVPSAPSPAGTAGRRRSILARFVRWLIARLTGARS